MKQKLFTTYSAGDDLTLFEIKRKKIKGIDYVLLLQKQEPNLIVIGFFDNGKLEIVKNKVVRNELLKVFSKDKKELIEKMRPFIDSKKSYKIKP